MSELDLGLKLGVRSLLWSMGFSTRLDVQLRGHERADGGPAQTFTDLDVLGVVVTPGYRLSTTIADCKSGKADKPTARMFWVRGVADLFGADDAMLVREHEVLDSTRQLSAKLGITVLPSSDLTHMHTLHGPPVSEDSPLNILFDKASVESHLKAFTRLDKKLKPLIDYRDFDYWVYDDHRNPFQMVAHLTDAAASLKPRDPDHLALFFDLSWLYLVTLIKVTEHIRGAFLSDPDRGLQEYLYGGPTGLKEKVQVADLLQSLRPDGARERDHLPEYYAALRELVTRLIRRPNHIQNALRHAEAASALASARQRTTLAEAFDEEFDDIASKLLADVCGFLVTAAGLHPDFRARARSYLLGEDLAQEGSEARTPQSAATGNPVGDEAESNDATVVLTEPVEDPAHPDQRTFDI